MRLTSVAADGFKNLKAVQFSPSPHYNLIIGENAQGKTNLLEAIWMMTGCRSFGAHGNEITSVQTARHCTLPLHLMTADGNRCLPATVPHSKTARLPATVSPLKRWGTCSTPFTASPLHRKTWHSSRERRMSGGSSSICRFLSCNRTVWSWCGGINSFYRIGMPSYGSL